MAATEEMAAPEVVQSAERPVAAVAGQAAAILQPRGVTAGREGVAAPQPQATAATVDGVAMPGSLWGSTTWGMAVMAERAETVVPRRVAMAVRVAPAVPAALEARVDPVPAL